MLLSVPGRKRSDGDSQPLFRRSRPVAEPAIAGVSVGAAGATMNPLDTGVAERSAVEVDTAPPVVPSPPSTGFAFDPRTTGQLPITVREEPAPQPAPEPVARPVKRTHRPRVRKVNRVVRHVDAWSVCRVAFVFFVSMYAILLVAGVLLWTVATSTGTIDNIESFIRSLFVLDSFTFDSATLLRASAVLGALFVVAGTAIAVTFAVLFNLIADLVGGIRVTVLEEEVVALNQPVVRRRRARRSSR
jgi:hypothetical protein